jgi:hypothetical protein
MELLEWASAYIDNLNFFRHDLLKKEIKKNEIFCEYKNKGELIYIIQPTLEKEILEKIKNKNIVLVCLNSKDNLLFMINNWNEFIKNQKLKVIFSNPDINMQWSLLPCTHNMISDSGSLKLGLKSMFESVPSV